MGRRRDRTGRLIAAVVVMCSSIVVSGVVVHAAPGDDADRTPVLDALPDESLTRIITLTGPEDLDVDDPLYPLMVAVTELRGQAQAAIEHAEAVERNAREARDAYELARFDATVAEIRADHARRLVNRWAAGMYRNDTGVNEQVEIINTALSNPARVLDIRVWFAQIANMRRADLDLADELIEQAQQTRREAVDLAVDAEVAAVAARAARDAATGVLEETERSLEMLLGQTVSYQIVIGADGCPTQVPDGTLRGLAEGSDVAELCARSVALAPTAEAALAIKYAFRALGASYACEGLGRHEPFRYDCSSLVTRAYSEGAGLSTATPSWIPTTRDLLPWGGYQQISWSRTIEPDEARPGDLVLYDTDNPGSRHVVLLLADGLMLHVAKCGDVTNVDTFWGFADGVGYEYLGVRHVDVAEAQVFELGEIARDDSQGFGSSAPWLSDAVGQAPPLELSRPVDTPRR